MNDTNSLLAKPEAPSRQDQINAWMALNRLNQVKLGRLLGITGAMVGMLLKGRKYPTPRRMEQLTELGFPVYLLAAKPQKPEAPKREGV